MTRSEQRNLLPPPKGVTRRRVAGPAVFVVICFVFFFLGRGTMDSSLWVYSLAFCWGFTALLCGIFIKHAFDLGFVDVPVGRKAHGRSTPLMGGVAIVLSCIGSMVFLSEISNELLGVIVASTLVWVVGLVDDRIHMSGKIKLVLQAIAVFVLFSFGVHVELFGGPGIGLYLDYLITFLWVVGLTNAINFLDGMDGLCAGVCLIISGFLTMIALMSQQTEFALISAALLGSCLGVFPYNFRFRKRALIFLGDNGATFLGFILASIVVMGRWAENDMSAIIVPVVMMAVPIYDITLVSVVRFAKGRVRSFGEWLTIGGRDHTHHRIAGLGVGRATAVLIIHVLTLMCGISALLLQGADSLQAGLVLLNMFLIFSLLTYFIINVRHHQIQLFLHTAQRMLGGSDELSSKEFEEALEEAERQQDQSPIYKSMEI